MAKKETDNPSLNNVGEMKMAGMVLKLAGYQQKWVAILNHEFKHEFKTFLRSKNKSIIIR